MYGCASRVLVLPLAVVVLAWLAIAVSGGGYPSATTNPFSGQVGQLCSPPFGYRKKRCGGEMLVSTTFDPACAIDYG